MKVVVKEVKRMLITVFISVMVFAFVPSFSVEVNADSLEDEVISKVDSQIDNLYIPFGGGELLSFYNYNRHSFRQEIENLKHRDDFIDTEFSHEGNDYIWTLSVNGNTNICKVNIVNDEVKYVVVQTIDDGIVSFEEYYSTELFNAEGVFDVFEGAYEGYYEGISSYVSIEVYKDSESNYRVTCMTLGEEEHEYASLSNVIPEKLAKIGDDYIFQNGVGSPLKFIIKDGKCSELYYYGQGGKGLKVPRKVPHIHDWDYTVESNKITVKCKGNGVCTVKNGQTNGVSLTINIPSSISYTGNPVEAKFEEGEAEAWRTVFGEESLPEIKFYDGDTELSSAPSEIGSYTANISVDGKIASKKIEIISQNSNDNEDDKNQTVDDNENDIDQSVTDSIEDETDLSNNDDGARVDSDTLNNILLSLTDDEVAAIKKGKKIKIFLKEKKKDLSEISEKDRKAIEKKIPEGFEVGAYLDIELSKQIGEGTEALITDLKGNKIDIIIEIPDLLKNANYKFTIVRAHEDEPAVVIMPKKIDNKNWELTFSSDKFSTYALCYYDGKSEESDGNNSRVISSKEEKSKVYEDFDKNKSEVKYGTVFMHDKDNVKNFIDMKVFTPDIRTKQNQQLLAMIYAQNIGKKARILDTKTIHPRNILFTTEVGAKKFLTWINLEKKAQTVYAVCYNNTNKAYYLEGTLNENGVAVFPDFIANEATNITLFVLE